MIKKLELRIPLDKKDTKLFLNVKQYLNLKQNTEVIRFLIKFYFNEKISIETNEIKPKCKNCVFFYDNGTDNFCNCGYICNDKQDSFLPNDLYYLHNDDPSDPRLKSTKKYKPYKPEEGVESN